MSETLARVHLVGSIGLDTVEEVFRTVGKMLGPHLCRIPDGEVGGRKLWISWQYPLLRASTFLRPDPSGAVRPTNRFQLLTLAEGVGLTAARVVRRVTVRVALARMRTGARLAVGATGRTGSFARVPVRSLVHGRRCGFPRRDLRRGRGRRRVVATSDDG